MILGDFHNFGNAVRREALNPTLIFKPRSLYWENLFFGKLSPLSQLVRDSPIQEHFSLEQIPYCGRICQGEVIESSSASFDPFGYGFLMGYCFFFGIQDLHYKNIIRTNHGAQPIDVEVVLSDLITPSQTLLVPGRNVEYERTPLALYMDQSEVSLDMLCVMLKGYESAYDWICRRNQNILNALVIDPKECIRVIFRNSNEYRTPAALSDLTFEENKQISRGDIPFFFKFLSNQNVYYLRSEDDFVAINRNSKWNKISDIIGVDPVVLLASSKISRKYSVGLLSLVATFRGKFPSRQALVLANSSVDVREKEIHADVDGKHFVLKI